MQDYQDTPFCILCEDPLFLQITNDDEDSDNEAVEIIPDDLRLPCGCRAHWQCVMSEAPSILQTLQCPSCGKVISSPTTASSSSKEPEKVEILTRCINEGGTQEGLDIYPILKEEAYLEVNPQARPAIAFQTLANEGDAVGMVELLKDFAEDTMDADEIAGIVRFENPLDGNKNGIHLAVEHGHEEAIWLMLWLSSTLSETLFPDTLLQRVKAIHLNRLPVVDPSRDVRTLKTSSGFTAEHLAQNQGQLVNFIKRGILSV